MCKYLFMPLISIIIPVYNTDKYLKKCLNSILSQSFKDFEVICVNDGSNDNSLEILNLYRQKDERVIVISKNNEGQGIARNKGLEVANGKYVMFIDSDDWLENYALEKFYNKMEEDKCDVLLFNVYRYIDKTGERSHYPYATKYLQGFENRVFEPKDAIKYLFCIPAYPFKIYKKSTLDKLNYHYEKGTFWEDHLPHFVVLSQANKISILDDYLYNYRLHTSSVTANAAKFADTILENFRICEKELKKYDNWEIIKPYFVARKIKVALNYFEKFNHCAKEKWYKNMQKLFCYIRENHIEDLKKIGFNLNKFNEIYYMPYNFYNFYSKIKITFKIMNLYLRLNRF